MAYNLSKEEKDDALLRDTKEKIKREALIGAAIIKEYFKPISRSAFRNYSRFGTFPNLDANNKILLEVLNDQYSGTAKKFIDQVRRALGSPENADELEDIINTQSEIQQTLDILTASKAIIKTTQEDMNRSVRDAIVAAPLGDQFSDKKVARLAKKKFDTLSNARVDTISMTQTQQASEGAKHSEMIVLIRNSAIFEAARVSMQSATVKKTWMTVGDSKVRPAHADADFQTVNFDVPYTVGGQQLMYPRDTSLGATLDNVINCRCASIQSIRGS